MLDRKILKLYKFTLILKLESHYLEGQSLKLEVNST